jgi:hypothetical protein
MPNEIQNNFIDSAGQFKLSANLHRDDQCANKSKTPQPAQFQSSIVAFKENTKVTTLLTDIFIHHYTS